MYSEIGQFSLLLVAIASIFSILIAAFGLYSGRKECYPLQLALVHASLLFSLISIITLAFAFYFDDFAIQYVSAHSNSALPNFFKIAAVWGGHEGSLLFWVITLAFWNSAIALLNTKVAQSYLTKVLIISASLVAIFAVFTLFASNPFELNAVLPDEGRDLNPMLQDIALIFHPPLLYMGYIGFASSFALALAALWQKEIPTYWFEVSRKYTLFAWVFLTAGILLGAWWAYYELGWGGWWFWDPVENASLLPWLTATALVHSLVVSSNSRRLIGWTLGLSFITFSLSLLGTFVVRSGILTSVHAFAVDPTRGVVLILILLGLILAGFGSQIYRANDIQSKPIKSFTTQPFLFLLVNGLFTIAMITVLLGTFYPMVFQILNLGKISVGAPYFNSLFAPLTFIALLLMSAAPIVLSSKNNKPRVLVVQFLLACFIGFIMYRLQYQQLEMMVLATWILASNVMLSMIYQFATSPSTRVRLKLLPMWLAHLGIVMASIGASMNAYHSIENSDRMTVGTKTELGRFAITFEQQELFVGPNYTSEKVVLTTSSGDHVIPERRHYQVRVMNMTEPGIKSYWHGDLYITLGEKLYDGSFAVRIQYKVYVQWIWFGGMVMILGGIAAFVSRFRYIDNVEKVNAHN